MREAGERKTRKPAKIDLQIGELILRDIPYALRHKVAAAVEQELTHLLSEQGLPPTLAQGGTIPHLAIDDLQIAADAKADAIGSQIAQSLYSSLSAGGSER